MRRSKPETRRSGGHAGEAASEHGQGLLAGFENVVSSGRSGRYVLYMLPLVGKCWSRLFGTEGLSESNAAELHPINSTLPSTSTSIAVSSARTPSPFPIIRPSTSIRRYTSGSQLWRQSIVVDTL